MTPHASPHTPQGFFVTGTDTGVGKTLVACALLRAYAARNLRAIGMKPIAAGATQINGVLINEDVEQLIAASNVQAPREWVNPYCFEPPIAPHIAASENKKTIEIKCLQRMALRLLALGDVLVVEGAGGFCVPLNDDETSADLACALRFPVVLVVGMRLGCLNHALLTAQAICARGLKLAGWVANHIDAGMERADANVEALKARLANYGAPMLARVGYRDAPEIACIGTPFELTASR